MYVYEHDVYDFDYFKNKYKQWLWPISRCITQKKKEMVNILRIKTFKNV